MDVLQTAVENGVFIKWLSRDVPALKLVGESNTIIGCFYSSWKTRHPALKHMVRDKEGGGTFIVDVRHENSNDYLYYDVKRDTVQPLLYMPEGVIKRALVSSLLHVKESEAFLLLDIKYQIDKDEGMFWRLLLPSLEDDQPVIYGIDRPLVRKAVDPTETLMEVV